MKMHRMILLSLSILAAACQVERPASGADGIPVTIEAGFNGTRTAIAFDGTAYQPSWQKGDALYVMVDDAYSVKKTFTNQAEDGPTGTFKGSLADDVPDGAHTLTAFYPKAMNVGRAEQVFKFQLPEAQVLPSLSSFDPAADLLVAEPAVLTVSNHTATVDRMAFSRILGVTRLVLEDATTGGKLSGKKVKGIRLTSSSELMTGKVSVDITTGAITAWEKKSSFDYVSATYAGDDWAADGQAGAFLVVNPTTLAAGSLLSLHVDTDDAALEIDKAVTLPSAVTFSPLRLTTLMFRLEDANVKDGSGNPGGDDPIPGEGAELECPDPPQTGTVPLDGLSGYAAGVTGGDAASAANVLHFDNGKALQTWLLARTKSEKNGDHSPVTIWLSGTFGPTDGRDFSEAHPWFDVKDVSNLSFYGTDGFVMDRIGLFLVRASNIIIRNVNFQQPKANNGADAVSMQECDGVWVDHCTFTSLNQTKDYEDGSCDITHASRNVTVSWCRFVKTQKSCLVGHSNSATADVAITATFHHNWFDGSSSRHPRVRFGRVHVYNNLFDGCTTYGVGSAYGAKVLVEYNYFDGVQLPTDICTYPAKESNESNLQGSVAGYLYATQDVFVNRPAKAKDPYPLTNVQYEKYGGAAGAALTYADFKPGYEYVVTPAADVPEVVKAGAGYGKLTGYVTAPVAVNNGGITEFNGTGDDPTDPDPEEPDEPAAGPHTYTLSMSDAETLVATIDGTAGSTFFTSSSASADFRTAAADKYNGPFTIGDVTYQRGIKMDSKGYVTFKTSSAYNTTVRFWFARRKSADMAAQMQLLPTGGTATVFDTPYDTFADSGAIPLEKGTEYTIKQKNKEQAVILVTVTESE